MPREDESAVNAADPEWQAGMDRANALLDSGEFDAAYELGRQMVALCERKHLSKRSLAASKQIMGHAARNLERLQESEALLLESLQLRESVLPPGHVRVLQSVSQLGRTYLAENNPEKAEAMYQRALAGYSAMSDRNGPEECGLGEAYSELGGIYLGRKDYTKAEEFLTRALPSWEIVGVGCGEMHDLFDRIVSLLVQTNRPDKAALVMERAVVEFSPEEGEPADRHFFDFTEGLSAYYFREKRYADAERILLKEIAALDSEPQPFAPQLAIALQHQAMILKALGRDSEAEQVEARLKKLQAENSN